MLNFDHRAREPEHSANLPPPIPGRHDVPYRAPNLERRSVGEALASTLPPSTLDAAGEHLSFPSFLHEGVPVQPEQRLPADEPKNPPPTPAQPGATGIASPAVAAWVSRTRRRRRRAALGQLAAWAITILVAGTIVATAAITLAKFGG